MEGIFGTLVNATKDGDEKRISKELEYFVTCKSCYQTIDYMKEFIYDKINRKVVLQALDASVCQASFAQQFCNEFFKLIEANLDLAFDTAFKLVLSKDYVCHYVFPLCE